MQKLDLSKSSVKTKKGDSFDNRESFKNLLLSAVELERGDTLYRESWEHFWTKTHFLFVSGIGRKYYKDSPPGK